MTRAFETVSLEEEMLSAPNLIDYALGCSQLMTKFVDGIDINSCENVLVNHNGKQFQKLAELLSVSVFEAFGQYIHPTRYRQIIRPKKMISDDQKHSYNVACVQNTIDGAYGI